MLTLCEAYDRMKLRNGVITACKKRPISIKKIDSIVDEIENELQSLSQIEIRASDVGRIVMEKLKGLDDVAYVRFASVYKEFKDRDAFMNELEQLSKK